MNISTSSPYTIKMPHISSMTDKQWATHKKSAREPVFSQSSITSGKRRCCTGCNAFPCIPQCPIQHALAQRRRESAPIFNTIILPPVPNKPNISQNQEPRKAIPKKIRGEAWKIQFGESTKGSCFCCKKELDVFDDWHAGHIVSHSNNGTDTAINLRPVCGSCNLSMGTENMDAFKARCYPN